jgi:pimeloyl-ACP methyl ester carboxylesterase
MAESTPRAAIGVPAAAQTISIDGVQLAVAREGHGPTLVCLHAIGHGGADFDALTTALRGQFEIVRIDWPGHGRSGADRVPVSATRYAQLLGLVLRALAIEQPILIGCSIGGAAALIHAATGAPVRAVVACDAGGLVPVNALTKSFCGLFARFFAAGERRARWFPWAFANYYRRLVLPSPHAVAQRERIVHAGFELAPLLREAWQSFGRPEADIRALARSLAIPVWFAWAARDRVIPLRLCLPCIRGMRHATLSTFDAGHAAFLEQPRAFIDGFLAFTASIGQQHELA